MSKPEGKDNKSLNRLENNNNKQKSTQKLSESLSHPCKSVQQIGRGEAYSFGKAPLKGAPDGGHGLFDA